MLTKQAVEEYIKESPHTYALVIRKFQELCPLNVSDISRSTWEDYQNSLEAEVIQGTKGDKRYAPSTIKDKLTKVKCFLNYCVGEGYLKLNTKRLKIPKTLSRRNVAKPEQIAKMESLLNLYNFEDLRDYLLIQCMKMGMRVAEIASLNRSDIGDAKQYVSQEGIISYYCPIISKKSKQERYIMWSARTHQLFLRYLGIVVVLNQRQELFISLTGRTRLTTRSIERSFKGLCVQANILEYITPHSVRHMAAHIDLDKGATLKQIQAKLGHTNPASTLNYINQDTRETLKALGNHTPA